MTEQLNRHRMALVLRRRDIDVLEFDRGGGAKLLQHEEVAVVPFPPQATDAFAALLDTQGRLSAGVVLIQSPYDSDYYAFADQASQVFAQQKHFIFATLCSYLGATQIVMEQIEIEREDRRSTFKIDANFSVAPVSGGTEVDRSLAQEVVRKFALRDRLPGGPPDIDAALQLLTLKRLRSDPSMSSLVEARRFANKLEEREVVISLTEESKRNFRLAASVLAMVPNLAQMTGGVEYSREVAKLTEYSLKYTVKFT